MTAVALTIAGSDPSGGAGLQADLKTFHQHGVYGMSVVTLLTVQNTQAVSEVKLLEAAFVEAQLRAVLEDIPPGAAKTGALGGVEIIHAVAGAAADLDFPLIVDPVMISKHGDALIDQDAIAVLRDELLPRAFLVTPNIHEAAALARMEVTDPGSMEDAARALLELGPANVLIKGGSLQHDAVDVLLVAGELHRFESPHIESAHTHGTGCAYAAAITARLARGEALLEAVPRAKRFITEAIGTAPHLGRGTGPTNLHAASG
ncbi:MAG: bifunctional hydroxymethylpyrimidine kinase/phosphomethylpyrimidine kinase [Planctomycetota bacterium]|nr:bifunctional hydroxymethylpyrimidine kinase/phosphomethylpyrimidine kinase [Planctomycetota bacterium]